MNKALRKAVIAGNWKMNKTPAEAKELISAIAPLVKDAGCDVVACTPFVDLASAQEAAAGTNIQIGAENCHWEKSGAYTGEISAEMLSSMGVNIVIIGHSERRQYFGETDVTVQKRVRAALDAGLTVILCVGETLEQREQGITSELVAMQTKIALGGVTAEELKRIIIAYEPVWAIGTGKTATAEQANEVCHTIREVDRWPVRERRRRCFHHPVRRLHERRQRCRAAGPARRGRRPHRRRFPEAQRLRHHRQGCYRRLSPMNCPVCGKEMEPGFVQTNQRAAWVKKPHPLTLMPKEGEVLLDNKLFSSCSFPGWICRDCRKIVLDYEGKPSQEG